MSSFRITDVTVAGAYVNALEAANESAARARRQPNGKARDLLPQPSPAARARASLAALRGALRPVLRVVRPETA